MFIDEIQNSGEAIKLVTTQPLNMEFLPQIAQIYADLKPPKVVYWRKLIKHRFSREYTDRKITNKMPLEKQVFYF